MTQQIQLLGSFHIEDENGMPSDLMNWAKGCALLSYLFITRQAQSREFLADMLWEASSTKQSLQNLRKLLSRMRKWVPELEVTRKQVAYPMSMAVSIDLHILEDALASENLDEIDRALQLYKDDLLTGLYLSDAPRFNEWLILQREQIRQPVIIAYQRLCAAYAEQKEWAKGCDAARRWYNLNPLDEDALLHLLQFLAANNQIDLALQQYETSREILWAELGVNPESRITEFAEQLTQLKINGTLNPVNQAVQWPENNLSEPGPLPVNSALPYQRNGDFIGRQDMLWQLATSLSTEQEQRAVAITGMGGIGKTQLAVEFCYRYGRYFSGGVFWMSFADANHVAEEIAMIGGERGMKLYQDADGLTLADQVAQVQRAWQDPTPRLLIFDNCEDEALLAKWLPVTGGCRVIVTSRRAQWARELHVSEQKLQPLTLPESTTLLQQLAPKLKENEAQQIAVELGGLPLALHLAGGFLHYYRNISAETYLSQLREMGLMQHPSLQGRGVRHSPTGHDLNVHRTFAINLEQLNPADEIDEIAQQLLIHAACFAAGEPIPQRLLIATAVADETNFMHLLSAEDGLMRLIALGFLEVEENETVIMHPLLAAFAREMFDTSEVQSAIDNKFTNQLSNNQEKKLWLDSSPALSAICI